MAGVDVKISLILFTLIPAHLFISLWIEVWAAYKARKLKAALKNPETRHRKGSWQLIRFAHIVNVSICLGVTSVTVYTRVYHPLLGILCEVHAGISMFNIADAVIVALKVASYALTNRDLRDMYLESVPTPEQYASAPYPENVKLSNLLYFWWAPTLVYQPVYPRTKSFRWGFFLKRSGEAFGIILALWFIIAQYATYFLHQLN